MKHIVDLEWDGNGGVKATEKKSGDITTYHLKRDDKPEGNHCFYLQFSIVRMRTVIAFL